MLAAPRNTNFFMVPVMPLLPLLPLVLLPLPSKPLRSSAVNYHGTRSEPISFFEGIVGDPVVDLAADRDGLELLRAAAAAAKDINEPPPRISTASLACQWTETYIDDDGHVELGSYMAMADDKTRTPFFGAAIRRRLEGTSDKVVLDIGTGPFCLLALMAAGAGARRVFAVEANPVAAEQARLTVASAEAEGYVRAGVIEVIEGYSTDVTLPEKVDLLVAEIVGDIASEEGLVATMRDAQARHLLHPDDKGSYIPQRIQSVCAPASYVVPYCLRPPYSPFDFSAIRGDYPIRVSCEDNAVQLLSEPQLLEDFYFGVSALPAAGDATTTRLEFDVDEECLAHAEATHTDALGAMLVGTPELSCTESEASGLVHRVSHSLACLAAWPRLVLDDGSTGGEPIVVESRGATAAGAEGDEDEEEVESHWSTVLCLLSPQPLAVGGGDQVTLSYEATFGDRDDLPTRYEMRGELRSE